MGQHKYNPTAIKAKNGEIEPEKKPVANPIKKAEVYEKVKDILPMYREMEGAIFHSPYLGTWI